MRTSRPRRQARTLATPSRPARSRPSGVVRAARTALPAVERRSPLAGLAAKVPRLREPAVAARPVERVGTSAPAVVERLVNVIPGWVWVLLGVLALLASGGLLAALLLARRARGVQAEAVSLAAAADTDPLTGVLNRRGLHARLEAELQRATRYGRPLAVSYVDIAGFKSVNDRFGHRAGDLLLAAVADTLAAESRNEDLVGRVGGDEYLVALTEQDAAGAEIFWSRALQRLDDERAALPGEWNVTTGTAVYPEDGDDLESLLRTADRRLYAERGIELT